MKMLSLSFLFLLTMLISLTSGATTTIINVSGEILPETCDIDIDNLKQIIDLGEYTANDFPSAGSVTKMVPFSVKITNCTSGIGAANLRFSGTNINNSLFALQGGGGDLGVELLKVGGQPMAPGSMTRYVLTRGDNMLSFYMRLKSLKSSVTPGDLSATIFMDIEYE